MLSAKQREQAKHEIEERWEIIREHNDCARAELELIRLLQAMLAQDDLMRLRLVHADPTPRGEQCSTGFRLITGKERQSH